MQPSGELLHPPLLLAVFPPHEHLAEVDCGPDVRDLLLEPLEVPGVVEDDEVLQIGERSLLDVTRG